MTNTTETTTRVITVNANDIIKAVEFKTSSAYSRPESWMYFDGVFCMDFFAQDERPSVNDSDGFQDWLRTTQSVDSDESYNQFLDCNRDYYKSILLSDLVISNSDEEIDEEIKVTYI